MADKAARTLLISVETEALRESLHRFLCKRGCTTEPDGELAVAVAVADCGGASPALSTLVALVEDWRCAARAAEARLELDGRVTILRTET